MKSLYQRNAMVFAFTVTGLFHGCSFMYDVDDLEGTPCEHQECGPSLVFDGYDCGTCEGQFAYCDMELLGECVDDCAGLECGLSPNQGFDCGSCDDSLGEECNSEGHCYSCPTGISGEDCLDCAGGRYAEKTGLCWQDPPTETKLEQYQAITYCNQLVQGGLTDWTLPTVEDYMDAQEAALTAVSQ